MHRKAVDQRLKKIRNLSACLHAYRPEVTLALASRPAAKSIEALAYDPIFDHFQAELGAIETRLRQAEDAYITEKRHRSILRRQLGDAVHAMQSLHRDIRRLLCAAPKVRSLFLRPSLPQASRVDPLDHRDAVWDTLNILDLLESGDLPEIPGLEIDAASVAAKLRASFEAAKTVYKEHSKADTWAIHAMGLADLAVDEWEEVVPCVEKGLKSLCRLAGQKGSAYRVGRGSLVELGEETSAP